MAAIGKCLETFVTPLGFDPATIIKVPKPKKVKVKVEEKEGDLKKEEDEAKEKPVEGEEPEPDEKKEEEKPEVESEESSEEETPEEVEIRLHDTHQTILKNLCNLIAVYSEKEAFLHKEEVPSE